MKTNIDKIRELERILAKCERMAFNDLVSWDDVKNWKVGETKIISHATNMLIAKEENIMIFKTIIPPKTVFTNHWHDFHERNFIISGFYTNANIIYSKGTWVGHSSYEPHEVSNESEDEDLVLFVHFTKEEQ